MPRKGKGQQAKTTVKGQQYGQAKAQEESQAVVPLPEMEQPQMPAMRPGEAAFGRPTERPSEPIGTFGGMQEVESPEDTRQRKKKVLAFLPMMEQMSSQPYADPQLRNVVRQMKMFVGNMEELYQDRGQ
jgi:hypothetical protein